MPMKCAASRPLSWEGPRKEYASAHRHASEVYSWGELEIVNKGILIVPKGFVEDSSRCWYDKAADR